MRGENGLGWVGYYRVRGVRGEWIRLGGILQEWGVRGEWIRLGWDITG